MKINLLYFRVLHNIMEWMTLCLQKIILIVSALLHYHSMTCPFMETRIWTLDHLEIIYFLRLRYECIRNIICAVKQNKYDWINPQPEPLEIWLTFEVNYNTTVFILVSSTGTIIVFTVWNWKLKTLIQIKTHRYF